MSIVIPMFWLWIGLGVILCCLEVVFPTAFVEMMLGLSAFIIALVSIVIPSLPVQIFLWLLLSLLFTYLVRRFFPQRKAHILQEPVEATTLTAILPGQTGRVIYEGNSWQARCDQGQLEIAANEPVYVLRREGTTLIVLPQALLDNP